MNDIQTQLDSFCEIRDLRTKLAEAEQAIEKAGRCLVMSNNGKAEALAILRGYKEAAVSASVDYEQEELERMLKQESKAHAAASGRSRLRRNQF
jgi:PHD/YefM family antitoxin component YafN of YafNO toxin-antitoxin module